MGLQFIGNGKSSRCVVRKGKLSFVDRMTAAGHLFTIVDEYCEKIPKASIWLAGHQFTSNDEGAITVPYTTKSATRQTILLVNEADGFCSLDKFDHKAESYSFDARFFVDREALVSRTGQLSALFSFFWLLLNGLFRCQGRCFDPSQFDP